MNPQQSTNGNKTFARAITFLTIGFLAVNIWNVWEQHKYRKMEWEMKYGKK